MTAELINGKEVAKSVRASLKSRIARLKEKGIVPGAGALAAMIETACGKKAFYVGKPNPLMMRTAIKYLGVHSEDTIMVGDRMDTDIVAGVQSGMNTILVLSGITKREDVERFPYVPTEIRNSVADIIP